MPDPDQTVSALRAPQARDQLRHRGIREIHPTHDAGDEISLRRRLEKLACLVEAGDRLDKHRAIDVVLDQLGTKVIGSKGPADR